MFARCIVFISASSSAYQYSSIEARYELFSSRALNAYNTIEAVSLSHIIKWTHFRREKGLTSPKSQFTMAFNGLPILEEIIDNGVSKV